MVSIALQNKKPKENEWILLLVSDDYSFDKRLLDNASKRCGCTYSKSMDVTFKNSIISFHFKREGDYKRFKYGIIRSSLYDNSIKI